MGKWIAAGLIVAGLAMLFAASRANDHVGFDSGAFLGVLAGMLGGGACLFVGLIWLAILAFVDL